MLYEVITSLPYYIKKSFTGFPEEKVLAPIITFKYGKNKALEDLYALSSQLGVTRSEIREAFNIAHAKQEESYNFV